MASKVERMAAMVDDKTLISQLIRENSTRINLIEFKDARADIWQHFRLVQLDGQTLAYAVCVRCLKPVSYKAREGTGGLHRHPCSKAAAATGSLIHNHLNNKRQGRDNLIINYSTSRPVEESSPPSSLSPSSSPPAVPSSSSSPSSLTLAKVPSLSSKAVLPYMNGSTTSSSISSASSSTSNMNGSSLSNLSSIMNNPFLHFPSLKSTSSSTTSMNGNGNSTHSNTPSPANTFNFMYANGSIQTDCQAMILLHDSKCPPFNPVTEAMTDLFERNVLLDLTLVAKNGSIKVHKLAIAAASIVFEEALTSGDGESATTSTGVMANGSNNGNDRSSTCSSLSSSSSSSPSNGTCSSSLSSTCPAPSSTVHELDMKDYDLSTVRALVEFIYYGELNDSDLSITELLKLTDQYEMKALKFACAQRMYRNLTPENSIEFLNYAEHADCKELKHLIPVFITENASKVISTEAWKETFKDRSDLVANLLGVNNATDLSMAKKRKTS